MREAQSRGVVSSVRVAEDGRNLAQLRSQQVDTSTRLTQALKDRDDFTHRLDSFPDERRSRLGRELQDLVVGMEKTRSQIRSASERLVYTGALKAQMHAADSAPDVVIHRRIAGRDESIAAREDDPVLPDDMVEVVIRPDQMLVAPVR